MLHIMRNTASSGNSIVARGIEALRARLPERWIISARRLPVRVPDYQPDAVFEVRAPDGSCAILLVEARRGLAAQQAADVGSRLAAVARRGRADAVLLIAPFLSAMTRDRLRQAGASYLDLTGNARVALDRPALLIETQGAEKNPNPPRRGIRSLKGAKAARLVRALCDWRPPVGVRELARRAGANPGYTTRVLSLLEEEDVVQRGTGGGVIDVNCEDLLRRWAQDYDVAKTNRAAPCLAPRGLGTLMHRLRGYKDKWAITGSQAIPTEAATAPTRLLSFYVSDPERAGDALDLRPSDTGSNVLLLEPFDDVVWQRVREEGGLKYVAVSQCAVDLLTGGGRGPSEAESLFAWMRDNEDVWRA